MKFPHSYKLSLKLYNSFLNTFINLTILTTIQKKLTYLNLSSRQQTDRCYLCTIIVLIFRISVYFFVLFINHFVKFLYALVIFVKFLLLQYIIF